MDSERHCLAPARVARRSAIVIETSLVREAAETEAPLSINQEATAEKTIGSLTNAPTPLILTLIENSASLGTTRIPLPHTSVKRDQLRSTKVPTEVPRPWTDRLQGKSKSYTHPTIGYRH